MAPLTNDKNLLGKRKRQTDIAEREDKAKAVKREDETTAVKREDSVPIRIKSEPREDSPPDSNSLSVLNAVSTTVPCCTTYTSSNERFFVQALVNIGGEFKASKFYDQIYLAGRIKTSDGLWALPGGLVDPDENAITAAIDYVREQTRFYVEAADLGKEPNFVLRTVRNPLNIDDHTEKTLVTVFVVCNWNMNTVRPGKRTSDFLERSSLCFRKWDEIRSAKPLFAALRTLDDELEEFPEPNDIEESEASIKGEDMDDLD